MSDGPHGLRKQNEGSDHLGLNASIPATCFPTAATLANSWDRDLLYKVGQAIAKEALAEQVSVLLGPGVNVKRNPLGGRNFEYLSEDPYLAGSLAGALIQGVQSVGVSACPKHFAVNSQESYRMGVDEVVDERALNEIFLEAFRVAISEGKPWSLMTSYNRVNGKFAHEHDQLITEILRNGWGFDGTVVSDWGGNNDIVAALKVGSNVEMPSSLGVGEAKVEAALDSGELDEQVLDERVDEFLTLLDRTQSSDSSADFAAANKLAQKAAEESIILLKNNQKALPLPQGTRVGIIGAFADEARFQGAGSSKVNATQIVTPLHALEASDLDVVGYEPGFKIQDRPSKRLVQQALTLAENSDAILLFLGLDEGTESEGVDRLNMRLARNQLALTKRLLRTGKKIVVVLAGGAPIELPFAAHVDAILHSYLPGQAGGQAIANIIDGSVNPSGKLAESYPLTYSQVASAPDYNKHPASAQHRESIYIGYRYYDKIGLPVRYPFGFGLSYTTFAYDNLKVESRSDDSGAPTKVSVTVTNTGNRSGSDAVQVYTQAHDAASHFRPLRELAGFTKVHLNAGESKEVKVDLREHAFSYYSMETHAWEIAGGDYDILVGASSRDIRQNLTVQVDGVSIPDAAAPYVSGDVLAVSDQEFEDLLGRTPPPLDFDPTAPLTETSFLAQLPGHSPVATLVHAGVKQSASILDQMGRKTVANYLRFMLMMPLRSVLPMTIGKVSPQWQQRIIKVLNG